MIKGKQLLLILISITPTAANTNPKATLVYMFITINPTAVTKGKHSSLHVHTFNPN